jgi:DUF1680 family protein
MQISDRDMSAEHVLEHDAVGIYLGNLNTVDSDLCLPSEGSLGSKITWHSGEILFVSDEGKITRPTFGVGDRVVPLTAKLTYQDTTLEKQFFVTVIEQEASHDIRSILPVHVKIHIHDIVRLPAFVIVEKEEENFSVEKVKWDDFETKSFDTPGNFDLLGCVENTDLKAVAHIKILEQMTEDRSKDSKKRVFEFPGESVKLLEGSQFIQAQNTFLQYLLNVDDDQMLYNFKVAANLDTKGAPLMTGWDAPECNLKGHTTGHYLSALAKAYAGTKDDKIKKKLCYMVNELEQCQNSLSSMDGFHDGFLSAYSEEQFDRLEEFERYPAIWAPYYTLHKIMAGLLDAYRLTNNEKALVICTRLGKWVYNRLSVLPQEKLDKMWSIYIAGEFGGMSEVLTNLYFETGMNEFLVAANYFNNDKLYYPMSEGVDTLGNMHANQHIPQIIGSLKLYEAQGNRKYFDIANNFWHIVTQDHAYHIGGVGENEMFNKKGAIASYITTKTAESCASHNMLKLTKDLFTHVPHHTYMDYYENVLVNHILSACDSREPSGGTTYFMPLSPAGQKKFDTVENTCCHGTGLENPFGFTDAIYFNDKAALYVNLYIPSEVTWDEKAVTISQTTSAQDMTKVTFKVKGAAQFLLKLRRPSWVVQPVVLSINGEILQDVKLNDGYFEIDRFWNNDEIELQLPYSFHLHRTSDDPTIAGIFYGPLLLVALSDSSEYMNLSINENTICDKMKVKDGGNSFELEGNVFVPLNQIYHQKYSAYFKVNN